MITFIVHYSGILQEHQLNLGKYVNASFYSQMLNTWLKSKHISCINLHITGSFSLAP